jgi:hypothetical protein
MTMKEREHISPSTRKPNEELILFKVGAKILHFIGKT